MQWHEANAEWILKEKIAIGSNNESFFWYLRRARTVVVLGRAIIARFNKRLAVEAAGAGAGSDGELSSIVMMLLLFLLFNSISM